MSYFTDLANIRHGLISDRRNAAAASDTASVIRIQRDLDAIDRAMADEGELDLAETNSGMQERRRVCLETGQEFFTNDPGKYFVNRDAAEAYEAKGGLPF